MESNVLFTSVTIPVRLIGSHGYNIPGFKSERFGVLAAFSNETNEFIKSFTFENITILGIDLKKISVTSQTPDRLAGDKHERIGAWQQLRIDFVNDQYGDAIMNFLEKLGTSLTASFAPNQLDPWYGNLVVEFEWSAVRPERPPSEQRGVFPSISTRNTSVSDEVLTPQKLSCLRHSELMAIFAEGMRASQVKSKFANWFIPIERLESHAYSNFRYLFTNLYSPSDISMIISSSNLSGEPLNRLRGFLSEPTRTIESRATKLYKILDKLGLSSFTFGPDDARSWTVSLTEDVCNQLIKSRNTLAHAGAEIDQNLLYRKLFPLSYRVVIYLNDENSPRQVDSGLASC
jgi:hypothetical protein